MSTTQMPAVPTTAPDPSGNDPNKQAKFAAISKALGELSQKLAAQQAQRAGQNLGNQQFSPGRTVALPGGGVQPAGAGVPAGGGVPGAQPIIGSSVQMPQTGFIPNAPTTVGSRGMEFGTKKAAKSATVSDLVDSFTQVMNKVEQQDYRKKENEAKTRFTEYMDAVNRGDKEYAAAIANDPKTKQIWKKYMGFEPFEQKKPPEVSGVLKGAQEVLAKMKGQQAQKQQQQQQPRPQPQPSQQQQLQGQQTATALGIEQARAKALQNPAEMQAAATGSYLGVDQKKTAEMAQNGLIMAPADMIKLDANTQIQTMKLGFMQEKLDQQVKTDAKKFQTELDVAATHAGAEVEAAKIRSGPQYKLYQLREETFRKLGESKQLMLLGKVNEANVQRTKIMEDYAKGLRAQASKTGVDKDVAKQLNQQADDLDKQMKAIDTQTISPQAMQLMIESQSLGLDLSDDN